MMLAKIATPNQMFLAQDQVLFLLTICSGNITMDIYGQFRGICFTNATNAYFLASHHWWYQWLLRLGFDLPGSA